MNSNYIGIFIAVISLFSFIGLLIKGIVRSKINILIITILLIYLVDSIFISLNRPFAILIPLGIFLLYSSLLYAKPEIFMVPKIEKKEDVKELFDALFFNIQTQGVEAANTLKIIAKTYSDGNNIISIGSEDIIMHLIDKSNFWSQLYYNKRKIELGYLTNAAIISIANMSVTNKNKVGKRFIENGLNSLIHGQAPEKNDIIKLAIPIAKNILDSKKPNYHVYS